MSDANDLTFRAEDIPLDYVDKHANDAIYAN